MTPYTLYLGVKAIENRPTFELLTRLVAVKDNSGAVLKTYGYDGQGWRVTETVGATVRDFYFTAGWQVAEETVTTGSVTKLNARYVWGGGYVDDLVYRQRDTDNDGVLDERLWATHDANFNITALANDLGTVVERYAYDAYVVRTVLDAGWSVLGASAYGFVHGFQGLRYDEVAGLSDARNRWYSPTLARFVANDPIRYEAGDVNLYRFVGNSPGMGVDPWGLAVYEVKDAPQTEVFMDEVYGYT
jgi:RHS repeat-associated protein